MNRGALLQEWRNNIADGFDLGLYNEFLELTSGPLGTLYHA